MKYIVEQDMLGSWVDLEKYLNSDPHPGYRLVSCDPANGANGAHLIWERCDPEIEKHLDTLFTVCKDAYRKHCLDHEDISWEKMEDELEDALVSVMGEEAFNDWVEKVDPEETI